MCKTLLIGLLAILASTPLAAKRVMFDPSSDCRMNQTSSLSINFNGSAEKAVDVREKMQSAVSRVEKLAAQQGIKDMKIQSQNYSVNANNNYGDGNYQYSGNVNFNLGSSDKIFAFMDKLKEQRIMASLSVNEYQEGTCQ